MVPSIIDVWGYDRGFVHLLLLRLLLQIELAYLKNEITYIRRRQIQIDQSDCVKRGF